MGASGQCSVKVVTKQYMAVCRGVQGLDCQNDGETGKGRYQIFFTSTKHFCVWIYTPVI